MSFYEKLILESNNLETLDSIKIDNEEEFLADLELLNDANKFLEIIKEIKEKDEAILIFTDYDADGATSAAIMSKIFDKLDIKNKIVSSNKHLNEGYGLNVKTLKRLEEEDGVNATEYPWILTLDNGCVAFEPIEQAKELGFKVMVIDHHECEDELPAAEVVIDAKRKDSVFPFKEMCTAGMVYYLGIHLMDYLNDDVDYAKSLVDIAALGTAADMVCISDRNYYITKTGYAKMNNGSSLLDKFTILNEGNKLSQVENKEVDNKFLTWTIAPLINASVRVLGHALPAIELLKNDSNTDKHAEILVEVNDFRKLASKILAENAQKVSNPIELQNDNPLNYINEDIVVGFIDVNKIQDEEFKLLRDELNITHNFSSGLNGIVASQLMNETRKPTFIFSDTADENYISSSIRGYANYNLKEGLLRAEEAGLIIHAGGHAQAAGATIAKVDLAKFIQFMNDDYINHQTEEVQADEAYDLYENIRNLKSDIDSIKELHQEVPFGFGLNKPKFKIDMSKLRFEENFSYKVSSTGDKKHLFYNMSGIKIIFWNVSKEDRQENLSLEEAIAKVKKMDLDSEIEINSYKSKNGKLYENLQIAILIKE